VTDSQDVPPTEALTRRSLRESEPSKRGTARREPRNGGGIAALVAKHPIAWLASALSVAFLLLGIAAVFAGVAAGSGPSEAEPVPSESVTPPRPQPSVVPVASRLRTCSVASIAADPALSDLFAYVTNANTGEVLFDRNGTVAQRPASILKTLTAAAAIKVLGPDYRATTKVVDGSTPGTIVLVGLGDATLATTPATFYEGAALISDLADAAMKAYDKLHPDVPVTQVVLDASFWNSGDAWDPSWPESERTEGYQSYATALMVDGDRLDPTRSVSPRGTDPIGDAGEAFVAAAGLTGVTLTTGSAVGSTVLASVQSQPVTVLIPQMLQTSDNTLAEMLARLISKSMGFDGSAATLDQAIPGALNDLGLDASGLTVRDGSGLSDLNAVPPKFVTQLMTMLRSGENGLGIAYDGLPVGGVSGDLYDRFSGDNAIAAGSVIAKPGWLSVEWSLAGIVNAADGTPLAFAFYAIRDGITRDARGALDTLTTALYRCGDQLANN
jgi:D-alanyl-D-alanine carboxypeptidase/D-alanyl-D-alanine-endopeptidase (penicillin-binding protein 4)